MILKIGDIIVLEDNKKYIIVSETIYKNKKYLQLVEKANINHSIICHLNDDELVEIEDSELKLLLMPLFIETFKNFK